MTTIDNLSVNAIRVLSADAIRKPTPDIRGCRSAVRRWRMSFG